MIGSKLIHPRARKTQKARKARGYGLGLWWTFAAGLVLASATVVAIFQNSHHVRLHYLVWHLNVSLIVVVLTTALIAVFLDEVGGLIWRRRRRSMLGRRGELEQLRTQQLTNDTPEDVAADSPADSPEVSVLHQ
jgi:uncharacterized integral membrane protein